MKKMKYFILVFLLIILSLFVYRKLTKPETLNIAGIELSLEKPWEKFNDSDESKIGNLIRAYHFDEGEKRFKKLIGGDSFLIACLKKDKSWNFYYYYYGPGTYTILGFTEEAEKEITPPNE